MACDTALYWLVLVLLFVVSNLKQCVHGEPQVPCYFIFGDSLVDNGNNNLLSTSAKANYPPYGIDFPEGSTGRFCNGRTTADIIAEQLGFDKFIPPFATAKGAQILKGVNYASGSAGILDETGKHLGDNISLNKQIRNHIATVSDIVELLGNEDLAADHLRKCLYSVGMGNNDYINNYFLPEFYKTSSQYTPEKFAVVLIEEYSKQLRSLYNYGSRWVSLNAVGLIGCTPNAIALYGKNNTSCVEYMNDAADLFNKRLESLVDQLNSNLTDAKFTFVNDGSHNDFMVTDSGCCEVVENSLCVPNGTICQNRNEYLFWDSFHPSEAWNLITARRSYIALYPSDTYPMDFVA